MAENAPPSYTPNAQGPDFWAFIRSFENMHPGSGIDHVQAPPPFAFPFGPAAAASAFGLRGSHGPWRPHATDPCSDGDCPHGHRGPCRGRRCRRGDACDSDDEGQARAGTPTSGADGERDEDMEGAGPSDEKKDSPSTARDSSDGDAAKEEPRGHCHGPHNGSHHGRHGPCHRHRQHGHGGPFGSPWGAQFFGGPFCGRGRGGRAFGRGGRFGFAHHQQLPFDLEAWLGTLASHPLAQQIRQQVSDYLASMNNGGTRGGAHDDEDDVESFAPPIDIFETEAGPGGAWVVHVAVPGAKKEDIGISWRAEQGVLSISGVVYRPGDESFQNGLVSGERKVGMFKRDVRLPPPSSAAAQGAGSSGKEEIDAEAITARLEDGVLMVTVPRVEKEWTEVRKVDIM